MTNPEETKDPLVAKLIETYAEPKEPQPGETSWYRTGRYAMALLSGIPIETVAESLNKAYLGRVTQELTKLSAGSDWNPADWIVCCPPYLFHGWETINEVRIFKTLPLDWEVLIIRSPEWDARTRPPLTFFPNLKVVPHV